MKLKRFDGAGRGARADVWNELKAQAHLAIDLLDALEWVIDGYDEYELADIIGHQDRPEDVERAREFLTLLKENQNDSN